MLKLVPPLTFCYNTPTVIANDNNLFNLIKYKGRILRLKLIYSFYFRIKLFASVVSY